jgi:hypothetical protein
MPNSLELDEHVELLERCLVEQKLDALARGQFAARMLRLDALFPAAQLCARAPLLKAVQNVLHRLLPVPQNQTISKLLTRRFPKLKPGLRPISRVKRDGQIR